MSPDVTNTAVESATQFSRPASASIPRKTLFLLFFLSGFASLIYQVVWTRMAFAAFGIITPVLSVVLSVFMLGLAVGSLAGGWLVAPLVRTTGLSAAIFYGSAEFLIGVGAFAVPHLFSLSARLLLPTGEMNSLVYLLLSAAALAISIFPWCVCMGTTFPFMMGYVRERDRQNAKSFSFLYLANVLGAMAGTFLSAFALIEMYGFHGTLEIAAVGNFLIAIVSFSLGAAQRGKSQGSAAADSIAASFPSPGAVNFPFIRFVLFSTGFISMAMEVVWSRAFTIVLKTQVYSFASIIFAYLCATFLGSLIYRRHVKRKYNVALATLFSFLAGAAFLPVIVNDVRLLKENSGYELDPIAVISILLSILPFCAVLGYLTPRLIDDYSAGQPRKAGEAYAINVLGCILGPLIAGYFLLPWISQRLALMLLALPFIAFWLIVASSQSRPRRFTVGFFTAVVFIWAAFFTQDFEAAALRYLPNCVVRRDYVASVISSGAQREKKSLLVNGFGMTSLTPITKFMAHMPIALHKDRPKSILVICFGMGTTYRSCLSWNIDTTVVELVPSVVKAFGFYHANADQVLANPHGHIVIDDGRRYLKRCNQKFDIIIVDPPPPVEAAGSSLLFSREFYDLAKQHLNDGGIVELWNPTRPGIITDAIIRSMYESFPYMRCYNSCEGWGLHLLGSMQPIPRMDPTEAAAKMPAAARADLLEWTDTNSLPAYLSLVLDNPYPVIVNSNPNIQITDDHPFNEYYILRQVEGQN